MLGVVTSPAFPTSIWLNERGPDVKSLLIIAVAIHDALTDLTEYRLPFSADAVECLFLPTQASQVAQAHVVWRNSGSDLKEGKSKAKSRSPLRSVLFCLDEILSLIVALPLNRPWNKRCVADTC